MVGAGEQGRCGGHQGTFSWLQVRSGLLCELFGTCVDMGPQLLHQHDWRHAIGSCYFPTGERPGLQRRRRLCARRPAPGLQVTQRPNIAAATPNAPHPWMTA